jgi:predicted membrane-bound spermidine synthase
LTSFIGVIFFFSGFASLIYQVVWQRLLTLHYGVGAIAITLIVSVYMFGLGVGALIGGYLAERIRRKVLLYFIVEAMLGLFGLGSLSFLDVLGRYTAGTSYTVSLLCMVLFLSLPTLLMGITLPLLTKIFNSIIRDFFHSISLLYFINTLGAAIGALFASYLAITFWGLDGAIYCAVAINILLALAIVALSRLNIDSYKDISLKEQLDAGAGEFGRWAYLCVFITGFLAIGYEIVWFRVIGVLVKSSPYSFSSMLFMYLAGIALGSFTMEKYIRQRQLINKRALFFRMQFLIGVYVIVTFTGYYYLTLYTPFGKLTARSFGALLHPPLPLDLPAPALIFSSVSNFLQSMFSVLDIFFWPGVFIFIPTVLMGASFPLISYLGLSRQDQEGKTVGTVYFFNVAGNLLGGIVTGFILLPLIGSELSLLLFSLIGITFILFKENAFISKNIVLVLVCCVFSIFFFPRSGALYRAVHTAPGPDYSSYFEEGVDGVIMTYIKDDRVINYINGVMHGLRPGYAFYAETIITCSHVRYPKNVFIIGYGTGSIVEALLLDPGIEHITLVEINKALIANLSKNPFFDHMRSDRRITLIFDDGRRYLQRTEEKFDIIMIDPLNSTTAYSNNLYSSQFFALARDHLNPAGILCVWMDEHNVMPRTIATVFNYVNMHTLGWADSFCLASSMPLQYNAQKGNALLERFPRKYREGITSLWSSDVGIIGNREHIMQVTSKSRINQDWAPVCEYYLRPYDRWAMRRAQNIK